MKTYKSTHRPTSRTVLRLGAFAVGAAAIAHATGCHGHGAAGDGDGGGAADGAPAATHDFDGTSEQAFTQAVAQLFDQEAPELNAAVVGLLAVQLVPRAGDPQSQASRVTLDRVWNACKTDTSTCEPSAREFVKKSVRSMRMNARPATRENIVAILRSRAYVDSVGGPATTTAIIDPFVGDLYVVYMVELPDSLRSLSPTEIDGIVQDRRALPQVATVNLAANLGRLSDVLAKPAPGSFDVLQSHNALESSRLLLGDEWAVLQKKVGNASIVVAAPGGDTVLVGIGPTHEQLAEMRDTARKMFSAARRPVSPSLFRWSKTTWTVVP
jgi:hypothetical protein